MEARGREGEKARGKARVLPPVKHTFYILASHISNAIDNLFAVSPEALSRRPIANNAPTIAIFGMRRVTSWPLEISRCFDTFRDASTPLLTCGGHEPLCLLSSTVSSAYDDLTLVASVYFCFNLKT